MSTAARNYDDLSADDPIRTWDLGDASNLKHDGPIELRKDKPEQPSKNTTEADLLVNRSGDPRPVLENIIRALQLPSWEGRLVFDELAVRPILTGPTPAHAGYRADYPRPWADADDAIVAAWLQAGLDLFVKPGQMPDAVIAVAKKHSRHPVRKYLSGLKWDKTARLDDWLRVHLGAGHSKLIRAFAAKFLIAAVARAFAPGVKVDHMLILEGPQGSLKSTVLEALMPSPDLFTDDLGEVLGKEAAERIQGKWLCELSELDAMSKAETTRVKSFITRQVDHFRPAYGRHAADFPRQCVFAGTTNQETYLKDETGGRRFWPVRIGKIDVAGLRAARDQLWAEAFERYHTGESWWLEDHELTDAASAEQRARFDEDVWHQDIADFIAGRDQVQVTEILKHLGVEPARQGQAEKNRVVKTLRHLRWERGQVRSGDGSRPRIYRPSPLSRVPAKAEP